MTRTLEVLNDLEKEGVFTRYAIGGATAATFYAEPSLTFDLAVFVLLRPSAGGLISLDFLRRITPQRPNEKQFDLIGFNSLSLSDFIAEMQRRPAFRPDQFLDQVSVSGNFDVGESHSTHSSDTGSM